MKKLLLITSIFISLISSCSNDNGDDPCPCEFTLSSVSGVENNSHYAETIVSMPNPCDSYLGQNVDMVVQLYENDGTYQNPVKGLNRVGQQRTASPLFTSTYLNALNSGVGSIISHGGGRNDETVEEYNCK